MTKKTRERIKDWSAHTLVVLSGATIWYLICFKCCSIP